MTLGDIRLTSQRQLGLNEANRFDSRPSTMTFPEALAILEAAGLERKKRDISTPEVIAALDLLEPHIQPY